MIGLRNKTKETKADGVRAQKLIPSRNEQRLKDPNNF